MVYLSTVLLGKINSNKKEIGGVEKFASFFGRNKKKEY